MVNVGIVPLTLPLPAATLRFPRPFSSPREFASTEPLSGEGRLWTRLVDSSSWPCRFIVPQPCHATDSVLNPRFGVAWCSFFSMRFSLLFLFHPLSHERPRGGYIIVQRETKGAEGRISNIEALLSQLAHATPRTS